MKKLYTVARVEAVDRVTAWKWTNKIFANREAAESCADGLGRAIVVPFTPGQRMPILPDLGQAAPWRQEIAT